MDGDQQGDPAVLLGTPGFFLRPDYHAVLRRLRAESPVHRTGDGMLAVSRYEDVRDVSRDPERFVSGRGVLINDPLRDPEGSGLGAFSILTLDPQPFMAVHNEPGGPAGFDEAARPTLLSTELTLRRHRRGAPGVR